MMFTIITIHSYPELQITTEYYSNQPSSPFQDLLSTWLDHPATQHFTPAMAIMAPSLNARRAHINLASWGIELFNPFRFEIMIQELSKTLWQIDQNWRRISRIDQHLTDISQFGAVSFEVELTYPFKDRLFQQDLAPRPLVAEAL